MPLEFLQELARTVLKNSFTSASEGYIDMNRYSRKTMHDLLKDFYNKTKLMEYIIKTKNKDDPQQIKKIFSQFIETKHKI